MNELEIDRTSPLAVVKAPRRGGERTWREDVGGLGGDWQRASMA